MHATDLALPSPLRLAVPRRAVGWGVSITVVALASWLTWDLPRWVAMCALAATLFATIKLATLPGYASTATRGRLAGYLFAWVGLDARAFFGPANAPAPSKREWAFAAVKVALGIALTLWAIRAGLDYAATCVGLVGLLLAFHFGVLHLLSCVWRAKGVMARPIMRAPIAATSLASLWGERWNLAFADSARRFLLKPLARPLGAHGARLAVFFFSGLVHEVVISVPARGGWGLPTLYFLLNGVGVVAEKSALGRRLGLGAGWRGWLWVLAVAGLPVPLLFHTPFVERVFAPLLHVLGNLLP